MKTQLPIDERRLATILKKNGVLHASIFGSFGRGDANEKSDVDLLVAYRPGTTLFDIIQLQNELEDTVARKVDLVSEKSLSKRLAKRIKHDLRPLDL